jgi:hypothetical protein
MKACKKSNKCSWVKGSKKRGSKKRSAGYCKKK